MVPPTLPHRFAPPLRPPSPFVQCHPRDAGLRHVAVPYALVMASDNGEALGVRVRQRPEQHAIDHAVDRGIRADAERKRHDGGESENGTLEKNADGVSEVAHSAP